jgi:hypothetical protein
MKFLLERMTQPEIEPVDLPSMKRHLREFATVTDNDTDITALITGGREWVEHYTGRICIDQTWRLTIVGPVAFQGMFSGDIVSGISGYPSVLGRYLGFMSLAPNGEILLKKSPVLSITSVASVGADGVETVISPSTYELREKDSKWPRLAPLNNSTWQTGFLSGGMRIVFRAGFADTFTSPGEGAEVVPVVIKQAIKLWVESNYDRDEKTMALYLTTAQQLVESECCELRFA